jgi:hypothetical protein
MELAMDFLYCLMIFGFGATMVGFAALCSAVEKTR